MHVSTRPPLARLQAIDSAVRRLEWPNSSKLARQLEVASRTILRDIDFMRCRLRAPIAFDSRRNGYYYTDASYRLFSVFQPTEGELVALLVAAQVLKLYRGSPFEKDIRNALAKIAELLPDRVEIGLDTLSECLSVLPRVRAEYDPSAFAAILDAVKRSRQLKIVYWTAGRNATGERVVDPYDLALAPDDDWCLLAYCHIRHEVRLFKIQRVRSVEETGASFGRPDGFRAADFMADTFGTIRGDGDHHVVLRFAQAYAGIIGEKEWHPGQTIEPQPDGTLILRLHVNDLRLIKRWVLYWGADCTVLEPPELKQMIASELRAIGRLYGG